MDGNLKPLAELHPGTFAHRPEVELEDVERITDVAVICEGQYLSADGVPVWIYTVAGELDGNRIEMLDHINKTILGATIGGDVMIIEAKDRKEADWLAINGLQDTFGLTAVLAQMGGLAPGENAGIITDTQVRPKAS
jgi:hypothetical protein